MPDTCTGPLIDPSGNVLPSTKVVFVYIRVMATQMAFGWQHGI